MSQLFELLSKLLTVNGTFVSNTHRPATSLTGGNNPMSYTVKQLDDMPIVLIEFSDPCDVIKDSHTTQDEVTRRFAGLTRPFFVIYDIRRLSFTFDDVVTIITDAVNISDDNKSFFEKYGRILIVGSGPLIRLATVSASRFLPTSGQARAFDTPEEALEYAHSQVVSWDDRRSKEV